MLQLLERNPEYVATNPYRHQEIFDNFYSLGELLRITALLELLLFLEKKIIAQNG